MPVPKFFLPPPKKKKRNRALFSWQLMLKGNTSKKEEPRVTGGLGLPKPEANLESEFPEAGAWARPWRKRKGARARTATHDEDQDGCVFLESIPNLLCVVFGGHPQKKDDVPSKRVLSQ